MRKFFWGVLVGLIATVLGLVIIVLAVVRLAAHKQPTIAANSALVLALEGNVPEANAVDIPIPFIQSQANPAVHDLWSSLREAARDHRIKAIVLQPKRLLIGWGKLEEIHEELLDFKKSGKPVYAFLQGAGSKEYYLASVADKIYMSPDDMLDVKGLRLEAMYFKNTLDKLGITVQVDHIGRYKDAGDILTKTNMSPETREVLNQVLDQLYGDFCFTAAAGRHKTPDQMRALVDQGPFLANDAKSNGLVDQLGYEDEVYSDLKKKVGVQNLNKTNIKSYYRAVPERGDRIAVLVGQGDIISGQPDGAFANNQVIASAAFAKVIRQVRDDKSIKGVILRVDSPGGDSVASDEILHELKLLSARKPLVISMSDVAASGGYFISVTGDPILAYPNTITGSIGVLYGKPTIRDLYGKLGISEETLMRGKFADIDSISSPLTDAEQAKLHQSIEVTYKSFVAKVAAARKKNYDQIDALAQGRVWMGTQARQNGLVDQLGGLDSAVSLVRQKARLSGTGETDLIVYPPKRSLFEVLTSSSNQDVQEAIVERKIRQTLPGLPSRALLQGGLLRILPYQLSIQ
ncbi:MAG TPA: signal peptide peptidase SppA [Bryobacteraceae bacterium]|nr:signal peptide peptidase SppA [Bryobacteraceae bacterium]